jgi:hypothetical protein
MTAPFRHLRDDERGVAFGTVLVISGILTFVVVTIVMRTVQQANTVAQDVRWEQSLNVAETGIAVALDEIETGNWGPFVSVNSKGDFDGMSERDWAIGKADAVSSPRKLASDPGGEYVILRDTQEDVIYSIGFAPSRASTNRRVRVVYMAYDENAVAGGSGFTTTYSLLTDGEVSFSGYVTWTGEAASMHANGHITISGTTDLEDGMCLTGSSGISNGGDLIQSAECQTPGTQPTVDIPVVNPRDYWHLSEWDMCPDGSVRAGPSHENYGDTVGTQPCTGHIFTNDASTPYRAWKFTGCCDSKRWAGWDYDSELANDGVYYFYQGSVVIGKSVPPGWDVTVIAEARNSCSNLVAGDITISGNPSMAPFQARSVDPNNTMVLVAGRDLEWSGDGETLREGVLLVKEQLKINGNPSLSGPQIVEDACDSAEDNIQATEISGNPVFTYSGGFSTIIPGPGSGGTGLAVLRWAEL